MVVMGNCKDQAGRWGAVCCCSPSPPSMPRPHPCPWPASVDRTTLPQEEQEERPCRNAHSNAGEATPKPSHAKPSPDSVVTSRHTTFPSKETLMRYSICLWGLCKCVSDPAQPLIHWGSQIGFPPFPRTQFPHLHL